MDRLTVSAIFEVNPHKRAWIAYLSACSTAEIKAEDLVDESIHLASAFQIAGFAHVIGSMWSADDNICVNVAQHFYRFLAKLDDSMDDNRAVAEALRHALLEERVQNPQDFRL